MMSHLGVLIMSHSLRMHMHALAIVQLTACILKKKIKKKAESKTSSHNVNLFICALMPAHCMCMIMFVFTVQFKARH